MLEQRRLRENIRYGCRLLDKIAEHRGCHPQTLRCDNGPEFTCLAFRLGAKFHKVAVKFIEPGKPMQNAYVESFNGRFRDECLNCNWFLTLEHARAVIEAWRQHSSLGYCVPEVYANNTDRGSIMLYNSGGTNLGGKSMQRIKCQKITLNKA